jgi:hypothetical protein
MENFAKKSKLISELEKIVTIINELLKSGVEMIIDAKNFIWSVLELMIERLFSFFESFFTRKEIIDLLDFKENDLFV